MVLLLWVHMICHGIVSMPLKNIKDLDKEGRYLEIVNLKTKPVSIQEQVELSFYLGKSHLALGNLEEAELHLVQALSVTTPEANLQIYFHATIYLGVCYLRKQHYPESIDQLHKALKLFESISPDKKDEVLIKSGVQMYFYLSESLRQEYRYEEALESLFKAINLAGASEECPSILLQIGIICNLAKKYDDAEFYLNKALTLFDCVQDKYLIADIKQQIGFSHLKQNRISSAIDNLKNSLAIYKELSAQENNIADIASTQFMLGIAYLRLRKYEEADRNLADAIDVFSNPQLGIDEVKKACALIKWVVHDERKILENSFFATYQATRPSFKKLNYILHAIEELENKTEILGDKTPQCH